MTGFASWLPSERWGTAGALAGGVGAALGVTLGSSLVHPQTDYPAAPWLVGVAAIGGLPVAAAARALAVRLVRRSGAASAASAFALASALAAAGAWWLSPARDWSWPTGAGAPLAAAAGVAAYLATGLGVVAALATASVLRRVLRTAPLLAVPAALAFAAAPGPLETSGAPASHLPRAVLLVTIDTLRADHVGFGGYARETSPFLDALAKESVVFERAYATMPTTDPSHTAILTGLHPRSSGVIKNGLRVSRSDAPSLAAWMRARGYRTGAITSRSHLAPDSLGVAGFQTWSAPSSHLSKSEARDALRRTRAWLARHGGHPFFLWVHLWDPHDPYDPPAEPERSLFVESYRGPLRERGDRGGPAEGVAYASDAIAYAVGLYDGEIRYTDSNLAEIVGAVRARFGAEQTLVVITADHGEVLGEVDAELRYAFDHGLLLRREALHVPLLWSWPGRLPTGRRVSEPVSTGGIPASLTELLGEPLATDVPSFAGRISGAATGPAAPVFAERRLFSEPAFPFAAVPELAVIEGPWLYVENARRGRFLHDLERDPAQRRNLLAERPELAERMAGMLRAFEARHPRADLDASGLDAEKLEALRALGYVQ